MHRVRAARAAKEHQEPARPDREDIGLPNVDTPGESGRPGGMEQQVVRLALYGGYTQDEIGELLGLAPATVAGFIRDSLQVASREGSLT